MAIASWYVFALECDLERASAGEWRARACSRPADDIGARFEETAPSISLSGDAIRIERRLVIPKLGVLDRLRDFVFGPRQVEDVFAIPIDTGVDLHEGDMLRASRDFMGRRHASLERLGTDGRPLVVWTFDDPKTGFA